jgi:hypothetical protein
MHTTKRKIKQIENIPAELINEVAKTTTTKCHSLIEKSFLENDASMKETIHKKHLRLIIDRGFSP